MLEHLNAKPTPPSRVVVLGARGFVGGASVRRLLSEGIEVLPLGRDDVDLVEGGAALYKHVRAEDTLIFVSAKAPCRDPSMLVENMRMAETVCRALEERAVNHVIYISSDAVYRDSAAPLNEDSCAEPGSIHGAMHLAREIALKNSYGGPLAILRPSLLYGVADPHNGYGPNRFRRLAAEGADIVLFGEGEERRDHVLIDDVAEIVCRVVMHKSWGTLNIATGAVASFREIAELVAAYFDPPPAIRMTERQGPMPHGGYRAFDIRACGAAFPDFRYSSLAEGLARVHEEAGEKG